MSNHETPDEIEQLDWYTGWGERVLNKKGMAALIDDPFAVIPSWVPTDQAAKINLRRVRLRSAKDPVADLDKAFIAWSLQHTWPAGVAKEEQEKELSEATAAKYDKGPVYRGVAVLFPRALAEVARVSKYGADKHEKRMGDRGYLIVPEADTVYVEAEMRHILAEVISGEVNVRDGGLLHKAQKAWNALADLEVLLVKISQRPVKTDE